MGERNLFATIQSTVPAALPNLSTRRTALSKLLLKNGVLVVAILLVIGAIDSTTTGAKDVQLPLPKAGETVPTASESPDKTASSTASNSSHQLTTNIHTTQTNGHTSTTVTVNGQPVAVPRNGTTQQIITTPNGQTQVTISGSQITNGQATENTYSQTTVNSSSVSHAVIQQEAVP